MTEQDIRISVVIPTYNSSQFIKRALDSVFSQTIMPYEIIVADDGSQDHTLQIVQDYANRKKKVFTRFKIYSQTNQGPGAARNNGIKHADGNWITFLDSDDVFRRDKLEAVMQMISSQPDISMVSHEMYYIKETCVNKKGCFRKPDVSRMNSRFQPDQPLFVQLYQANFLATSCLTVKKADIEKAGGFDNGCAYAEDYDLWIRIARFGRLVIIERPLSCYITRKGNVSADIFNRYVWEMRICRKYIPELYQYISGNDVKRMVRNRVIRIHLANIRAACRQMKICDAARIGVRLPFQLCRMKGYLKYLHETG